MSQETREWLNTQTLIGFTTKRGNFWHYDATLQGAESNHYPGAIPVEDVKRRLFDWTAQEAPVEFTVDGVTRQDPARKVIYRSDTGAALGVHKNSYERHQFEKWLVDSIATILDGDLSIGTAGLLKGGAVAWVSVEVPDNIVTPEGVSFRPFLLGSTSHDGSSSTQFGRKITNTGCDNTHAVALRERGQKIAVRHTKNSVLKVASTREALNIIYTAADDFAAEVKELCETEVLNGEWSRFLDSYVPVPDLPGRGQTLANNKRDTLAGLYLNDARVAPWAGTAWGVVQAVNTYDQHYATVRSAAREERTWLRAITGDIEKHDSAALAKLEKVLVRA